jgi:hypothetical protein
MKTVSVPAKSEAETHQQIALDKRMAGVEALISGKYNMQHFPLSIIVFPTLL